MHRYCGAVHVDQSTGNHPTYKNWKSVQVMKMGGGIFTIRIFVSFLIALWQWSSVMIAAIDGELIHENELTRVQHRQGAVY